MSTDVGPPYRRYRQPRRPPRLILFAAAVLAAGSTVTFLVGASGEQHGRDAGAAPAVTTPEPDAPRVQRVAEFTTRYEPGEPRVTNIRRAAELLDGTVLAPDETSP